MKKNLVYGVLSLAVAAMLASCSSPKNVAYIKNSEWVDLSKSEFLYDAHIMPKDVLTITVNTVNPEASAPYNLVGFEHSQWRPEPWHSASPADLSGQQRWHD